MLEEDVILPDVGDDLDVLDHDAFEAVALLIDADIELDAGCRGELGTLIDMPALEGRRVQAKPGGHHSSGDLVEDSDALGVGGGGPFMLGRWVRGLKGALGARGEIG